jgi:aryl-alcohol dehydrogenase-like predicted oxidoreductase
MTFKQIQLGKTDLRTARLGIGVGYRIDAKAIEWAIAQGINYIFWGSIRFMPAASVVRTLGSANRDKVIIATACYGQRYLHQPLMVTYSCHRALKKLRTDYLDVFQLGYLKRTPSNSVIKALVKLKEKGLVRHLGITTHNRKLAAKLLKSPEFEFFNIRYNAANRGAEKDLFPHLHSSEKILVNFTSTRWGQMLRPVKGWPENKPIPKAVDCYRFVLSRPEISICLTGASDISQLKQNVKALELGPMSEDELKWMREFGDLVYKTKSHVMESKKISPAYPE